MGRTPEALPTMVLGRGAPVVFLPGLAFHHGVPVGAGRLAERFMVRHLASGFEVHWTGRRVGVPAAYNMSDFADDYATEIRARFGRPMPVVGYSTGGLLGLQLALTAPGCVSRLVVVGAAHRLSDDARAGVLRWAAALESGRVGDAWRELAPDAVASAGVARHLAPVLGALGPLLTPDDCTDGIRTARAESDHDLGAWLAMIKAPTLLIVGDRDVNVGVELAGRTQQGLPDARVRVLAGAGHLGSLVRRRAGHAIAEFLDR